MTTLRAKWSYACALLLPLWTAAPAQAQESALSGVVRDQTTGRPIARALVNIVGSDLFAETGTDGQYRFRAVPPGQRELRASALGFAPQNRTVVIAAGTPAKADFALQIAALRLDELVVTATGEQAKREVGHAIARIDAAELTQTQPIANMNDLLVARTPGVTVTPGNLTGAEARVRIRGNNSLSLSNDPVYYIDGIRMESASGSSSIGIGGTSISRVNDLNPEELESIEFVKGPAASTLYGTDAANGVIVIKTKRGRAGRANWSAYAEVGAIKDYNNYPTAYRGWTTGSEPTNGIQCFLTAVAAGKCTQDRITTFNLFDDGEATPNGTGTRQQYGLQVNGGSEALNYFISGEWEDEIGLLRMPDFAQDIIRTDRQISEVPFEALRPNARNRVSVRANMGASLSPTLDLAISTGYVSSNQRLPQTDNNTTGLLSNGFGGPGHKDNGRFGYRLYTPDMFFSETVEQDINRFIGSGTATWKPAAWFSGRVTGGVDYVNRVDTDLCRRGECTPFNTTNITGFKEDNRTNFFQYTADASGSAEYQVSPAVKSRTTVGVQYFRRLFNRNGAFAEDLAPGATTVTAGAIPQADETTTVSATLGTFIDEQIAWRDKLYLNAAVRIDDNSAFGADFSAVMYPKFSASWVISEESFFPAIDLFDNLRLRAAWGASGVQPGTTDAVAFFTPTTASVENEDRAAIVFSALGNKELKPERSSEFELGLDAGVLSNRVGLELTFYHKTTKDALIARTVAPSVGGAITRFENLGSVQNTGVEGSVHAQIIERPGFGWHLTLAGAHNKNELADLGGVPPIIGTTIHQREGFPLNSYWLRPYTFEDADGNGIITANEIMVEDSAAFIGANLPETEITLNTGIQLFARRLSLNAGFDYKGGHYQLNGTERIRCESRLNCDGLIDPGAPLWKQARVVALRETAARTQYGFVEDASFVRLREVSATYELPANVAGALRARRVLLTAAGRNLHVWTDYSGIDPEAGYFGGGDVQTDFQTQAPPSYWTLRATFNF
ncbi:MAG: SusC/RagA family TonB-linked outer membrane protein [Gemmatimonadota bacterium]